MSIKLSFILALFRLVFYVLMILLFITLVVWSGSSKRYQYQYPVEPKNAYMVHMFEQGVYQEQLMCNASGSCLLLRTTGAHSFRFGYILVDGDTYTDTAVLENQYTPVARGIYCPGRVGFTSCYEVVMVEEGQVCPPSITILGYEAPLYEESCLTK